MAGSILNRAHPGFRKYHPCTLARAMQKILTDLPSLLLPFFHSLKRRVTSNYLVRVFLGIVYLEHYRGLYKRDR